MLQSSATGWITASSCSITSTNVGLSSFSSLQQCCMSWHTQYDQAGLTLGRCPVTIFLLNSYVDSPGKSISSGLMISQVMIPQCTRRAIHVSWSQYSIPFPTFCRTSQLMPLEIVESWDSRPKYWAIGSVFVWDIFLVSLPSWQSNCIYGPDLLTVFAIRAVP